MSYANEPIFIIASERSGTNLIRKRISDNQKHYLGPSPAHLLKNLYYQQPYYGDLSLDENFKKFISDALDLCLVHFSPWKMDWTPESVLRSFGEKPREAIYLMHHMMNSYAREQGYEGYICKDNFLYEFAIDISTKIPGAKFIYLYRDPRDFVLSQIKRPGAIKSVARYANLWAYEQTKAIAVSDQLRLKEKCFFVSYEGFISEEDKTVKEILDFLGLDQVKGKGYQDNMQERVHEWANLSKETKRNNYGKFFKELSKEKIKLVESICGRQMSYLNYQIFFASNYYPKNAAFYFDVFLGILRKKVLSLFSNVDKSSAVQKRSLLLSKMNVNYRSDSF